jgi:hypothetical protein
VRGRLPAAYLKIVGHFVKDRYHVAVLVLSMQESCKPLTLTREVAAAKSCAFKIESQDFEILLEGSLAALHPSTALWILAPLNQPLTKAKAKASRSPRPTGIGLAHQYLSASSVQ